MALSGNLITEQGKRNASKILGIKTFKDMYQKTSSKARQSQQQQLPPA